MALQQIQAVPDVSPGGETCIPSKSRPIDLVHLARQTCGDRSVEEAVLAMFMNQLSEIGDRLAETEPHQRKELAHTLVGAARGVGAFGIADCAAAIEGAPGDPAGLDRLALEVQDVRNFVASISR